MKFVPYVVMVNPPTKTSEQIEQLRAAVRDLQATLRRMQQEREHAAKLRRRRLLTVGVSVSLLLHIILLIYLSRTDRFMPGPGQDPVAFEFALVNDQELTELDDIDLSDLQFDLTETIESTTYDEPALTLDAAEPAAELMHFAPTGVEALGGAGEGLGGESGLSAGGGASYFGIASRGTRFAYIVDRSGSMSEHERMRIAVTELARSIQALPDFAFFYVLFFSSNVTEPPMQRGWMQARRSNIVPFVRWLNTVDPGGGTVPRPAFMKVLELDVRPDVIYFLTDGIISGFTAEELNTLNRQGKPVVIHTIAFGDDGSEELLRQIARDSGGTYRFVPDRGVAP